MCNILLLMFNIVNIYLSYTYMYIVIICCLNIRQNRHKFGFLASSYREVWEISIWASPNIDIGCYRSVHLGNFQKCQVKVLKYWQILWPLSKFHLFPSLGTATHIIWLQFGKFPLFPHIFGSLAVKAVAFFEISSFSS